MDIDDDSIAVLLYYSEQNTIGTLNLVCIALYCIVCIVVSIRDELL